MTPKVRNVWLLAVLALHALGAQASALDIALPAPADCPMHGDGGHHHDQAATEAECDCERGDCQAAFKDRNPSPALPGESSEHPARTADTTVQFAAGCLLSIPVSIYRSRDPPVLPFS